MRSILASVAATAALALATAAPASAANQALIVSGLGGAAMPDFMMADVLGGMFGNYERHGIPWPQPDRPFGGIPITLGGAIEVGADNLDNAITEALARTGPGEHVTVVGLSAGSLVVDEELRRLAADPDAPDKDKLNVIVVGDSSRFAFNEGRHDALIDFTYERPAETVYDTTVVTAEYDGFADYPDRQWNVLAVANAIAGEMVLHIPSMFSDLSEAPADSITVTTNELGGVTTSYLLPTDKLPLVRVMPLLVVGQSTLRDMIDAAYVRNDDTVPAASTAAPVSSEADPADPAADPDAEDSPDDPSDEPALADPVSEEGTSEEPEVDEAGDPEQSADSEPGRGPGSQTPDKTRHDQHDGAHRSPRTGRGSPKHAAD